ncbi:peptidoglycan DD-metalloendopeptidase family protein [Candidatus Latescibacterota bacterium]
MSWKNLTFILIPHSQSKIKQIKVKRAVLFGFAIFLIAAIGVMIFYIVGFQNKSFHLSRSRDIKRQNEILAEVVSNLDSSLTSMSTKIDSIEATAEKIRNEARISDMDLKLNNDDDVQLTLSGLTLPLNRILSDVNHLEKRSEVFEKNFSTLYEKCMDNVDFLEHLPSIRPAKGTITKEFNFLMAQDIYSITEESHPGINITNDGGTPILVTADGVVVKISNSNELGRYIEIDHENGYKTRYTHLNQKGITVKAREKVTRGQTIGLMGNTGMVPIKADAPHVMYTVEHNGTYVNPADYFIVSANASSEDILSE